VNAHKIKPNLYHNLGTFLLKMCQSYIVYIYMHSALTGVQVLLTRTPEHAHWLAHFCWGLLIVTAEKQKATGMSYSDPRSLVTFFWGFILWHQGTCFYVWLWYKRERTSKHWAIWLILGGYAHSYKSNSLVFRCSFYYWMHYIKLIF
jgi:hypothetical protein